MGSAASRPSRPPPRRRRSLPLSACLCGRSSVLLADADPPDSSSSAPPPPIDYNPSVKPIFRARLDESIASDNLLIPDKDSSLNFPTEKGTSSSVTEDIRFIDSVPRNNSPESSTQLRNANSFTPNVNVCQTLSVKTSGLPSTSAEPNLLELRSIRSPLASPLEVGNLVTEHGSVTAPVRLSNSMPQLEHAENVSEVAGSPGLTEPSEQRDGGELPADLSSVSVSLSSGFGETSMSEARRNSRRLFWDVLSRRISRRNIGSSEALLSAEGTASQDRWLFDFDSHTLGDDLEEDSVSSRRMQRRRHRLSGLTLNSRPEEISDRIQSGFHDNSVVTNYCPSGLHQEGTCSCNSLVVAEVSNTRASFARIVMLAEALFEVLDEIHRQPGTLGLSAVSLPAQDSIVNSLPLRVYNKNGVGEKGDDNDQCYICLAEYEEGESIRILPCRHEYHMACVDKWLKEIHGVCPLCRGNVGEGATTEGSDSIL